MAETYLCDRGKLTRSRTNERRSPERLVGLRRQRHRDVASSARWSEPSTVTVLIDFARALRVRMWSMVISDDVQLKKRVWRNFRPRWQEGFSAFCGESESRCGCPVPVAGA